MKVGITGFPGSGKSTIFQSLAPGAAEPKGRAPVLGNIKVPDDRVDFMASVFKPKKTTYAEITFVDVPGGGDPNAGALAADVVGVMRNMDVLVHVVRCFDNPYSGESAEPVHDLEAFQSELVLQDLVIVERRVDRMIREHKKDMEFQALSRCLEILEQEIPLRREEFSEDHLREMRSYSLLSLKPLMTVYNLDESGWEDPAMAAFKDPPQPEHADECALSLCGQMEAEVAQLPAEEQLEYLEAYGLGAPARHQFIRSAYAMLDLISFLTIGEDECRAWPIRNGTPAVKAAGKVHSDLERGFIRAEVVAFEDFKEHGSEAAARKVGKLRVEGKTYLVQDGDCLHILFNV